MAARTTRDALTRSSPRGSALGARDRLRLAERRLLLPQTVMAEVGYMLEMKVGTFAEVAFLESVANGSFDLVDLTRSDCAHR